MADYFTTPKTDWADTDGIGYEDLNRIEANSSAIRFGTYRKVQGLGYVVNNAVPSYDGLVTVLPGSCFSNNGVPIRVTGNFTKNLTAWAQGNGAAFGGMASAVTVAAKTWYYIFVISNPIDGSNEIMFDDNPAGTNVISLVFTEKRLVGAFKTANAGGDGSFDLMEMYSIGDHTYINPTYLYDEGTEWDALTPANEYVLRTLLLGTPADSYPLPAIQTRAALTVIAKGDVTFVGLMSNLVFTVPDPFVTTGVPAGEWVGVCSGVTDSSFDVDIIVDAANKINVAMFGVTGSAEIRVRGFYWDRRI